MFQVQTSFLLQVVGLVIEIAVSIGFYLPHRKPNTHQLAEHCSSSCQTETLQTVASAACGTQVVGLVVCGAGVAGLLGAFWRDTNLLNLNLVLMLLGMMLAFQFVGQVRSGS